MIRLDDRDAQIARPNEDRVVERQPPADSVLERTADERDIVNRATIVAAYAATSTT
jgi:hypothetical protein